MSHTPTKAQGHPAPGTVPYSAPTTPKHQATIVGFIGLGNMGAAIAKNLVIHSARHKQGGYTFLFWNRTIDKATKLAAEIEENLSHHGGIANVTVSKSVEELAIESDIIITSTPTDQAMLDLAERIAKAIKEAKTKLRIVVDMSTLYPATSGKVDSILTADAHTRFVASPVFGAPQIAKDAKLLICLAGDYASKKKVAYLLVPGAGRKVLDLGGNVEKAAAFKLLGNSYIVGTVELLAEGHTFAQKLGVGSQLFHEFLTDVFPAPSIVNYSKRITEDNFDGTTGFNIDGGLKDVHHMQRLSAENNVPLPIVDLAQEHMLTARALNATQPEYLRKASMDWSALTSALRVGAGLDPFDSSKHKIGPVPETE